MGSDASHMLCFCISALHVDMRNIGHAKLEYCCVIACEFS